MQSNIEPKYLLTKITNCLCMGFDNSFHLMSLSNCKLCYVSAIHIKLISCKHISSLEFLFWAMSLFDWPITKKNYKCFETLETPPM